MSQQQGMSRVTLDLSREQHRELKVWLQQAAREADLVQVPMAVVLRLLIAILTLDSKDDEYSLLARELQRTVLESLRDEDVRA